MQNQIITITVSAANRINELVSGAEGQVLRLGTKTAGCSGVKYEMNLADAAGPYDEVVQAHGATLYVDPLSLMFIAGTEVDWVENDLTRSFQFKNPNETGQCGCGESFTVS